MMDPARRRAPRPMRTAPVTFGRPVGYPMITPSSMSASGPSWTSAGLLILDRDGGATGLHRRLDRHQRSHDATRELAARERRTAGGHCADKFQALVLQRLARFDFRAHDIAIAHQKLELPIGVRDRLLGRDAPLE